MTVQLVVTASFPIHPPRGGGQRRAAGLYGALAELGIETTIVCLVGHGVRPRRVELAPGLVEIDVPKTAAHDEAEIELEREVGTVITDVALSLLHELTPAYANAIASAAAGARAVVACHPYAYPAIRAHCDLPVVYEAQDVEADLKAPLFAASEAGRRLLSAVTDVERECVCDAALVMACLEADGTRLHRLYDCKAPVVVVPNGVDLGAIPYTAPDERAALQAALGLDRPPALFVGSWHPPNLEALDDVLAAAAAAPEQRFLVVGSVGAALGRREAPPNVDICGTVDGGFLRSALAVAAVALNPVRSGSGTNLKMLDYAAAGVPIISTPFGARGLEMVADRHYVEADADTLAATLAHLDPAALPRLVEAARAHVEERFGWRSIASGFLAAGPVRELLSGAAVTG